MNKKDSGQVMWLGFAIALCVASSGFSALGAEVLESAVPKLKYEEPSYLTGTIYGVGSNQPLFKFQRVARRSGSTLKVQREFTYADGKLAVREHVVYEGDELILYEMEDLQTGAHGSATIQPDASRPAKAKIEFEYGMKRNDKPKLHTENLREDALIADMVGGFLLLHWDELMRGEKVKCRYIVVPRAETVGFTFEKDSESTWKGKPVLVVKMEATSRFIAALVNPLFFTIEKDAPHRVVQYIGRTTPKIQVGGKWKDVDAVTVFDWTSAR
jgi:hypothetical protein